MENEFGVRLRKLRKQAGLSQRKLAGKVGIDFSYLSKIESGAMPPPSKAVILKLAEELEADKDELLILAGKIPADIAQILKNQKALQLLRSDRIRRKIGEPIQKKKERVGIMKKFNWYRSLSKIAIPATLVIAMAASLWFASPLPAKALEISFPALPSGELGTSHSFSITIDITGSELLPIQSVNLEIYNVNSPTAYKATANNLPLTKGGSKSYTSSETGGGALTITATSPNDNWGYFASGTGYAIWKGYSYSFGSTPGFGYGYAVGARLTYTGTWTSPDGWPEGNYQAKVSIVATSAYFSETFIESSSTFTLSAAPVVTVTPQVVTVTPGVVDVSQVITAQGTFTQNVAMKSADAKVEMTINKDTVGKTKDGAPLTTISVTPLAAPPAPPARANVIGLVYDFGPDGATFSPPITISMAYDPTNIPAGVPEGKLKIAYFDTALNNWVDLSDITVNTTTRTISGKTSHFTAFTVIASLPRPATLAIANLSISPIQANSGQTVTISAMVTNTGELAGPYKVTLKINGITEATQDITLAGAASQTVTFTTSKTAAGTYSVDVNGLSGSFTVKAAEVPAKPAAFTIGNLSVSPAEVDSGKTVTISAVVINTGEQTGNYQVTLKINDATEATQDIILAGAASQTITFTTSKTDAGTYTVSVNGLNGSFTIKAPAPPPPAVEGGLAGWVWAIIIVSGILVIGLLVYFLSGKRAIS